jgi:hypothetical protein
MKEIPNKKNSGVGKPGFEAALGNRIFRTMAFAVAFSVLASLPFAQWRVTSGLLVGGILSLLNYRWLSRSISVAFDVALHATKPRIKLAQYVLRYIVIAAVIGVAYQLDFVSLTATLVGLCSFVVALFVEAFRELYFAIIHREEVS